MRNYLLGVWKPFFLHVYELQSSVTCIFIRVSMHYAVFCVFKSHVSLALNSKQQALCTRRLDFCIPNGANSEPVTCNCCSCSCCCLWLINELVDQREDLRSHWKFWPISLLYPPKEHNSDKKYTRGKYNCNCHCVQSQDSVYWECIRHEQLQQITLHCNS